MKPSIDIESSSLTTPKSSKKRKSNTETPEASKKKRKHREAEEEIITPQEVSTPGKERKSKKESKKKKKERLEHELEEGFDLEEQDAEFVDAPDNPVSPEAPALNEENSTINGVDSLLLEEQIADIDDTLLSSKSLSCFYKKRLSLQVPIPSIALSTPTSSLLSLNLSPLILTYFPPAEGIILSFSDPVLSADPAEGVNLPLPAPTSDVIPQVPPHETFVKCADGFGVCWVWLTATFMVFCPQKGDDLKGWTNVTSEGFVGLVSYNYFQTSVGKSRIPKKWVWNGPTREINKNKKKAKKGKLKDEDSLHSSQKGVPDSQDISLADGFVDGGSGTFVDENGDEISSTQSFKVVDVEMVPGHEKDKWTLQVTGSLLSPQDEASVVAEERQRFDQIQTQSRSRSKTPGLEDDEMPLMSGALPFSRVGSPT